MSPGDTYFVNRHEAPCLTVPRYDVPIAVRGKYYVHTGSTLQEITGLALNEFIMKRTGKTWDNIPEQRASINDIEACIEYELPEPVLRGKYPEIYLL